MSLCNFPDVFLHGAVADGATRVPEKPVIQLRIYSVLGNGLLGNGGADGQIGVVDVAACKVVNVAKSMYFSLERKLDGKAIALQLLGFSSTEDGAAYQDLFFKPIGEDSEVINLESMKQYTFSYTSYLPVIWKDNE